MPRPPRPDLSKRGGVCGGVGSRTAAVSRTGQLAAGASRTSALAGGAEQTSVRRATGCRDVMGQHAGGRRRAAVTRTRLAPGGRLLAPGSRTSLLAWRLGFRVRVYGVYRAFYRA
jgi:hypothetical protein